MSDEGFEELLRQYGHYLEPPRPGVAGEVGHVDGRYSVRRIIGKGGLACVFLAIDDHSSKRVALKMPLPEIFRSRTGLDRFAKETSALKTLSEDSGIVHYHDGGAIPGKCGSAPMPFVCMDYVPGCTVKERLQVWGRLPQAEAVRIALETCASLSYMHSNAYAHRDIKPGNLVLDILHSARVRIADLGLAFRPEDLEDDLSKGDTVGTTVYIAPERFLNPHTHAPSEWADLYSLGVTLYEMLTGRRPIQAETPGKLFFAIQNDVPRDPAGDGVHPPLAELVMRLLAKKPSNRPASAAAVKTELQQLLGDIVGLPGLAVDGWPALSSPDIVAALRHLGAANLQIPLAWCNGPAGILFGLARRKQLSLAAFEAVFVMANKLLTLQFDINQGDSREVVKCLGGLLPLFDDKVQFCAQCIAESHQLPMFRAKVTGVLECLRAFAADAARWKEDLAQRGPGDTSWKDAMLRDVSGCFAQLLALEHVFIDDQVYAADLLLAETARAGPTFGLPPPAQDMPDTIH